MFTSHVISKGVKKYLRAGRLTSEATSRRETCRRTQSKQLMLS